MRLACIGRQADIKVKADQIAVELILFKPSLLDLCT